MNEQELQLVAAANFATLADEGALRSPYFAPAA
jgi:hypothetical protein